MSNSELGILSDKISDPYIGTFEEVLMCGLHDAIHIVMHKLIRNNESIKMEQLDAQVVKEVFERRLIDSANRGADLRWKEEDHKLMNEYFKQTNQASIHKGNT